MSAKPRPGSGTRPASGASARPSSGRVTSARGTAAKPSSTEIATRPGSARPGSSKARPASARKTDATHDGKAATDDVTANGSTDSVKQRPASGSKKSTDTNSSPDKTAEFEFSGERVARSLPEYLIILDNELIPRLVDENDVTSRKALGHTLHCKLNDLNAVIRSQLIAKDQIRRDVYGITGSPLQTRPYTERMMSKPEMDRWLKHEQSIDQTVCKALRDHLQEKEVENQMLREMLNRRQNLEKTLHDADEPTSNQSGERRGSTVDRLELLEGIIKKQDSDINLLQMQIEDQNTKYVFIPKADYMEITRTLQPYVIVRKGGGSSSNGGVTSAARKTSTTATSTMAVDLKHAVGNIVEQIERLRGRIQQTSDTIKDQEKDKEVSLKILQEDRTAEELREVLARKVNEWQDHREMLEGEISSLRYSMESLAQYNRSLMDALAKNQEAERDRKESARLRRISCPQPTALTAEEGIRRAAEKRQQRRATVTSENTPRMASVQLSLGENCSAVKK